MTRGSIGSQSNVEKTFVIYLPVFIPISQFLVKAMNCRHGTNLCLSLLPAEFRFILRLYLPISKSSPCRVCLCFQKLMQDLEKTGFKLFTLMLYKATQLGCYVEQFERLKLVWIVDISISRVWAFSWCSAPLSRGAPQGSVAGPTPFASCSSWIYFREILVTPNNFMALLLNAQYELWCSGKHLLHWLSRW